MLYEKSTNYNKFFFLISSLIFYSFAFEILWNAQSEPCQNDTKTRINFTNYIIKTNKNYTFRGDKIVLLYEGNIGLYPHLKNHTNGTIEYINKGLPQLVNMTEHLKKLEENINNIIKDVNFSGLVIIDIEEWRPTYDSNWSSKRIYRNQSIELVLNTTNITDTKEAEKIAIEQFDKAAINFFNKTLHKCKELRKNAKWGFYGFPTCNENAENRNWSFCFPNISDKTIPIFKYVDAMYPAPYIVQGQNYSIKNLFVQAVLNETQRIVDKIYKEENKNKSIYVYQKIEVDPFTEILKDIEFYDPYYLCIGYKNLVSYNVDGIIVWTTSKNMSDRCLYIKNYTESVFGPYIKNLKKNFLISSQTTIFPTTISQTTLSSRQTGSLTTNTFSLNDCNQLLTEENIKKWCETNFYGPNCKQSKLNSSGLLTTTPSPS
uniref:Hyaluronidase n=1 Tax=Strongyloides papillosus TaxID=174720 RepID=A0A0N5C5U2_STREA